MTTSRLKTDHKNHLQVRHHSTSAKTMAQHPALNPGMRFAKRFNLLTATLRV